MGMEIADKRRSVQLQYRAKRAQRLASQLFDFSAETESDPFDFSQFQ